MQIRASQLQKVPERHLSLLHLSWANRFSLGEKPLPYIRSLFSSPKPQEKVQERGFMLILLCSEMNLRDFSHYKIPKNEENELSPWSVTLLIR